MTSFKGKRVAVDSMILIYILEDQSHHRVARLLEEAERIIVSTLLVGEVLTGFLVADEHKLYEQFMSYLETTENIEVQPFGLGTAVHFSELRARYRFPGPDCIHIATAVQHKADYFLTNDKRLKSFRELKIIQLGALADVP